MKRSWPLVKREGEGWAWSVLGSGGTRYERDTKLERILLRKEHVMYEKPEILATYTEEELQEEAAICVCYAGCLP